MAAISMGSFLSKATITPSELYSASAASTPHVERRHINVDLCAEEETDITDPTLSSTRNNSPIEIKDADLIGNDLCTTPIIGGEDTFYAYTTYETKFQTSLHACDNKVDLIDNYRQKQKTVDTVEGNKLNGVEKSLFRHSRVHPLRGSHTSALNCRSDTRDDDLRTERTDPITGATPPSSPRSSRGWALLRSVDDQCYPSFLIESDVFRFGRNANMEGTLTKYRQISSVHFTITRHRCRANVEPEVELYDQSSNGTIVNNLCIHQDKYVKLRNGDHIAVAVMDPQKKYLKWTFFINSVVHRALLERPLSTRRCREYKVSATSLGKARTVVQGEDVTTGEIVAIKRISRSTSNLSNCEREISIMTTLHHDKIVKYLGCRIFPKYALLYMEWCEGGSLRSRIDANRGRHLRPSLLARHVQQLLLGLRYLHSRGICHNDIKASNILFTKRNELKISDFGLSWSKHSSVEMPTLGSVLWAAPEILREQPYSFKSDVWSLGCTIIEMLTGLLPWSEISDILTLTPYEAKWRILKENRPPFYPSDILDTNGTAFLESCLNLDPGKRPECNTLLNHSWLDFEHCDEPSVNVSLSSVALTSSWYSPTGSIRLGSECSEGIALPPSSS